MDMTDEARRRLLEKHLNILGEHFDAVVILATWCDGAMTEYEYKAVGNQFCIAGMAEDYSNAAKDALTHMKAAGGDGDGEDDDEEDDDEEEWLAGA